MEKRDHSGGGVDIVGLLTLLFIALKLCGVIDWSWWWVLSPVWVVLGIAVVVTIGILIVKWYRQKEENERWRGGGL